MDNTTLDNTSQNMNNHDIRLSSQSGANKEAKNSIEDGVKQSSMTSLSELFEKKLSFKELNLPINEHLLIERLKQIEKDLMPEWNTIEKHEQAFIHDLISKWNESTNSMFNQAKCKGKAKNKELLPLQLNWQKMSQKGSFNFEIQQNKLNKDKMSLFRLCCTSIKANTANDEPIMQPNSRLILKAYKQLINAFEFLQKSRSFLHESSPNKNNSNYWKNLNSFIISMSKAIIRLIFYVQNTATSSERPISIPPMYSTESDCVENCIDLPKLELETLHQYSHLCFNELNSNMRKSETIVDGSAAVELREPFIYASKKNNNKQRPLRRSKALKRRRFKRVNKAKYFKLIINCAIKLVRLCFLVKENLIMKQINYDSNFMTTDVDIYAHYLLNECNLIYEYLKRTLDNSA
jgi:hypothetical protein